MPQPNGPTITRRRQEMGIPRSDFADRVGLSYQHLYAIEKGTRPASIEALWRIAKALDLPIGDVVSEDPEPEPERRPA